MGYHLGKTMVQEAAEVGHNNPAYLLNSSLPQRPVIIGQLANPSSYGGRPLGPHSYDVPNMPWMDEPERQTASFASKTKGGTKSIPPLTAEVDFINKPELIDFQRQVAPGFHSYTWGKQAQRPHDPSDTKLDRFYDYDSKLVRCRPTSSAPAPGTAVRSEPRPALMCARCCARTHRESSDPSHALLFAPPPPEQRGGCWRADAA